MPTAAARTLSVAMATTMLAAPVVQAAPAEDDEASVMGILPTSYDGELERHWRVKLEESLYAGLSRADHELLSSQAVEAADAGAASCASPSCFAGVAQATGADHLVASKVSIRDRDFDIRLQLIDGSSGEVVATADGVCEMCGVDEAATAISDQAAALSAKLDAMGAGGAQLLVQSTPSGAMVFLDGASIGQTPLERELEPGTHMLRLQTEGYEPREVEVESVAGVDEKLSFHLQPIPNKRRLHARAWGWTTFAVGLGLVAGGGTLLGIDERPYRAQCSGPNMDFTGKCRFRYDTLTAGAVLTAAGGAVLALSIWLLVESRDRKGKRRGKRKRNKNRAYLPRFRPAFTF